MKYLTRIADEVLRERLAAFGAVLIEGPKWTGKTTTAIQQAQSVLQLQDPDHREDHLATAATMPSLLLKGKQPRLIDEWQDAPTLWDAVRVAVDKSGGTPGQYILTGSNTVDKEKIFHSGTGRISRMKMLPMSLWESGDSSGEISLRALFDNPDYDINGITSKLEIPELIRVACRGGWPATLQMSEKAGMIIASDYVNSVCEVDISSIDKKQRSPKVARQIMRSYAVISAPSQSERVSLRISPHRATLLSPQILSMTTSVRWRNCSSSRILMPGVQPSGVRPPSAVCLKEDSQTLR